MKRAAWIIGIAVVGTSAFVLVLLMWIGSAIADVTDAGRYPWAIGELRTQQVFQSCPALSGLLQTTIPSNASRPIMLYRPGFLQGGTQLEIKYQLPAADRAALEAAWSQSPALQASPSEYFTGWLDPSFSKNTRTYTWKPGVTGAPTVKSPNPELTGINFECAIDDKSGQVGYRVDVLK
jgi:hypothetical protein